ncbi:hypothetical protein ACOMHN_034933 [Nucella lapillus]
MVDSTDKGSGQRNWGAYRSFLNREGPRALGSKEIPQGAENCLEGLTFVMTGVLESVERDEAKSLIERHGGRVTGNISNRTSYLIVGRDPGASKISKAEQCKTKQVDEDGLLDLVRTLPGKKSKYQEKAEQALKKEQSLQRSTSGGSKFTALKVSDCRPPQSPSDSAGPGKGTADPAPSNPGGAPGGKGASLMWVDRHRPAGLKQIIGQQGDKSNAKKLLSWIQKWHKNRAAGTKPSGRFYGQDDGSGHRAALLSGPPGIGKTTTAVLVCKEAGFSTIELNASDKRSKRSLKEDVAEALNNMTLVDYMGRLIGDSLSADQSADHSLRSTCQQITACAPPVSRPVSRSQPALHLSADHSLRSTCQQTSQQITACAPPVSRPQPALHLSADQSADHSLRSTCQQTSQQITACAPPVSRPVSRSQPALHLSADQSADHSLRSTCQQTSQQITACAPPVSRPVSRSQPALHLSADQSADHSLRSTCQQTSQQITACAPPAEIHCQQTSQQITACAPPVSRPVSRSQPALHLSADQSADHSLRSTCQQTSQQITACAPPAEIHCQQTSQQITACAPPVSRPVSRSQPALHLLRFTVSRPVSRSQPALHLLRFTVSRPVSRSQPALHLLRFTVSRPVSRSQPALHLLRFALYWESSTVGGRKGEQHCVVMDEVDGMAGSEDRGGLQELVQLVRTTRIPILCICNDRNSPKMRTLATHCFDLRFQRPRLEQIKGALMSIAFKEGVKISPPALQELILSSNQDIRQCIHNMSMWTANHKELSYDQAKQDAQHARKDLRLGIFDVSRKIFAGGEETAKMTLNDKSDLFFQDYSFVPLFVHQNYVSVSPFAARGDRTRHLSLLARAADSICEGDLVDRRIRAQGCWSLLPTQAMLASVIPGEYMRGSVTQMIQFPAWLGKNSTTSKTDRVLQELRCHMALRVSCDKRGLNMDYLPALRSRLTDPLGRQGSEGVGQVIQLMDDYDIVKDDFDNVLDITRWPNSTDPLAKLDPKTKAAFTRQYNKESHMTPYATGEATKKKRGRGTTTPEEDYGMGEGEEGGPPPETDSEKEDDGLERDTMIKVKKGGKTPAGSSKGKPSAKGKGDSKAKGKGKGKGGKGQR